MVTLTIGGSRRELSSRADIEESWITQQVTGRHADGDDVCATVHVKSGTIDLNLATPACAVGGGSRQLTSDERRVVDLWLERGLGNVDFTGGNLVAFLNQLFRLIS